MVSDTQLRCWAITDAKTRSIGICSYAGNSTTRTPPSKSTTRQLRSAQPAACLLTPPRFRPRALIRAALSDGPVGLHDLIQIAEKEGVGRSPVVNFVYNNALGRIVRVERGVYGLPEGADPWWYDLNDEYISGEGLEEHARATLSSAA